MAKGKEVNSASKETHGEENDQDQPAMNTRTRSGRLVRRPSGQQCNATPARAPSKRTRRSVIAEQKEPEEQAPELVDEKPVVFVEPEAAEERSEVPFEPDMVEKTEVCVELETVEKPEVRGEPEAVEEKPEVHGEPEAVEEKPEVRVELEMVVEKPEVCVEPVPVEEMPAECVRQEQEEPRTDTASEVVITGIVSQAAPTERAPTTQGIKLQPPKKKPCLDKSMKDSVVIPLGKPKSGRVWKDRNKQRFSALVRDVSLCTTWEKKMQAKREKQMVQKYMLELKEQKAKVKEEKRKRREENLKRREENARKAEIVQVIRNTAKIKRMKKKQLRKIEKRDTLALLEKSNNQPEEQPEAEQQSQASKEK
nr:LOW QUALITY PROTEIN: coiled-coil domain-containing protein 86-like [Nerophis lumbriciformis]